MSRVTGKQLDKLNPAMQLEWFQSYFILQLGERRFTMHASEVCDLARELLRAAVSKGGF